MTLEYELYCKAPSKSPFAVDPFIHMLEARGFVRPQAIIGGKGGKIRHGNSLKTPGEMRVYVVPKKPIGTAMRMDSCFE